MTMGPTKSPQLALITVKRKYSKNPSVSDPSRNSSKRDNPKRSNPNLLKKSSSTKTHNRLLRSFVSTLQENNLISKKKVPINTKEQNWRKQYPGWAGKPGKFKMSVSGSTTRLLSSTNTSDPVKNNTNKEWKSSTRKFVH